MLESVVRALMECPVGTRAKTKLSVLDYAVLEVAFFVAALDGSVLPCEVAAFRKLAKTCRGATSAHLQACQATAVQMGGPLLAMAQLGIAPERRIEAFVAAALATLPSGFAEGSLADLRRAFVLWVTVAVSDGEYSDVERQAIAALYGHFAQVRLERSAGQGSPWVALSPSCCAANGRHLRGKVISLLEPDFLQRVEALLSECADESRRAAAEQSLIQLVGTVVGVEAETGERVKKSTAKTALKLAVALLLPGSFVLGA